MKSMWANGENGGSKADQKGDGRDSEDLKIRTKYLYHRVRMRHYALTNWKLEKLKRTRKQMHATIICISL